MCDLCQMQFRIDHQERQGAMCRCGRFRLGKRDDVARDGSALGRRTGSSRMIYTQVTGALGERAEEEAEKQSTCYHCYVEKTGIHERCSICALVRVN